METADARWKRLLARIGPELGAASWAVAWYFYLGYGVTLNPTHIRWMLRGDWAAYFWGWSFFRNSSWSLPLGNTPELFWPLGTSVAFTDANPVVAVLLKPLSPWLPLDFQYFGAWYLACFVLQGVLGVRIARLFTADPLRTTLSGCLFALTPLLPARNGHITLCSFFFITALLLLYLRPSAANVRQTMLLTLLMLVWASGTHGYLSVMVLALSLALIARLALIERLLRPAAALGAVLGALGATIATYVLFGYIGWKQTELTAGGFGDFSSDLAALVNPQEWSRWFGPLPRKPRQGEGFAYLGAGTLGLLTLGLPLALRRERISRATLARLAPLVVVVLAMWVFAWSSRVTWLGEPVLDLSSLYAGIEKLTGTLRSSGRFVWPLHLLLLCGAVWGAAKLEPRWLGRSLLALAVAAQAAELNPKPLSFQEARFQPLAHAAWASAGESYRHIALHPLQVLWVCPYDHGTVNRLSYEAYRRHLTFNSGNFGRKEGDVKALCKRHLPADQPLDPATIYVVDRKFLADFARPDAVCGTLDGLSVCVEGSRSTPLAAALRNQTVVLRPRPSP